MHTSIEHKEGVLVNTEAEGYYDVIKMTRSKDGKTITYNKDITITNISLKAFSYQVNGKSVIDWVVERYQVSQNKDSLIKNNPKTTQGANISLNLFAESSNSLKRVQI